MVRLLILGLFISLATAQQHGGDEFKVVYLTEITASITEITESRTSASTGA